MEIRNRGKRRCQFKDGDSILHNDRIYGDNNPRPGGDVKVQINKQSPELVAVLTKALKQNAISS